MIGCTLNDGTVRLFDVKNTSKLKDLGHVLYPGLTVSQKEESLNAFKFHSRRGQFGVVSSNNVFGMYTVT